MNVNLDADLLRTFIAIAEEGGFTAASRLVCRTQSAVSQQMRRLEEALGTALFVKVGRQRYLNQAGQNLLTYARQIIALNDQAVMMVNASQENGEVRIGAPHDIADSILPRVLSAFAKTNPRVHIMLKVDRSPSLMPLLEDGRLDMTLTTRHTERFEGKLLRSSPTVWISSTTLRLERNEPIPLVLADSPSIFRRIALSALEQRGVAHVERYTCPTLTGIHVALNAGLGITARTPEMINRDLCILGEREGLPPLPDINFYIYRRNGSLSLAVRALFDQICAEL
ncbi:LysR substrate-binding domain-containing protein [Vreelandella arcis]|uniref:DNA-binding transcriptional regulator, LysR family n=1 Tax=Vreelandella arcis TaxID=416873 RepID=A0A1H0BK22_9GAMM|nr:LysR substrate-binding domain-containing protein [Halomonas arcis]SDN46018.1 DNA-binding transcriptional regulator, LysR family [Halomonas arcis]